MAKSGLPLDGIRNERQLLEELKARAQTIINTSELKPKELREKITEKFTNSRQNLFTVNVISFGFKHGIPIDADLVFDVRFLPNPFYIEQLRPKTGLDQDVYEYVMKWTDTSKFLEKISDLLSLCYRCINEKEKVNW